FAFGGWCSVEIAPSRPSRSVSASPPNEPASEPIKFRRELKSVDIDEFVEVEDQSAGGGEPVLIGVGFYNFDIIVTGLAPGHQIKRVSERIFRISDAFGELLAHRHHERVIHQRQGLQR